jgi:hypothetical protein
LIAHLFNLPERKGYLQRRPERGETRPVTGPIGELCAPAPNNQPGCLRLDSAHQVDQDGL